jgi:hypothetical protein
MGENFIKREKNVFYNIFSHPEIKKTDNTN